MPNLESMLIADMAAGKEVELERALLIVSGADTEEKISEYKQKLDEILQRFDGYLEANQRLEEKTMKRTYMLANSLHNFLWQSKPNRYNDNFLLTEVIDSQLNDKPKKPVGNCVGLTSLYTVLGLRLGMKISVLLMPEHVSCVLHDSSSTYVIEATNTDGFNLSRIKYISDSSGIDQLREVPVESLVAGVLGSRGYLSYEHRDYADAISFYDKTIELMPDYVGAYINRGNAKGDMKDYAGALADYAKSIEINPNWADAYKNRGLTKAEMRDYAGALADYQKALEIEPANESAKILIFFTKIRQGLDRIGLFRRA